MRLYPLLLIGACGGGSVGLPSGPTDDDAGAPRDAAAPGTDGAETSTPPDDDAQTADAPNADADGDGIPDATEAAYAQAYMPFLSVHPSDNCPLHGIIYRVSPHPKEPKRVMMWVDVLYNEDCGTGGHAGDDEEFGVVIDPSRDAPAGILAVRAVSHQGTPCQHTTTCGSCTGMKACATTQQGGKPYPVVYPSKDKHGNYADLGTCSGSFICDSGGCSLASVADGAPKVNVGEPTQPLVHDLTTEGFVTAENGWTKTELLHFDPWKAGDFGGAGDVSKDLVDGQFVVDTTACP